MKSQVHSKHSSILLDKRTSHFLERALLHCELPILVATQRGGGFVGKNHRTAFVASTRGRRRRRREDDG